MDKGSEGILVRFEPFWGLGAEGKRARLPSTRAPRPLRGVATAKLGPRIRGSTGPGSRVSRPGASRGLRRVADRFRDGPEQGRHPLSQCVDRTGTGEMEENPVLVLFDLGGAFAEGEEDGRGLRLGEGGML